MLDPNQDFPLLHRVLLEAAEVGHSPTLKRWHSEATQRLTRHTAKHGASRYERDCQAMLLAYSTTEELVSRLRILSTQNTQRTTDPAR